MDAFSSVDSAEKHAMLRQQSDDGDGMKVTDAGDSFTRGPWPAAAVRCWNSPGGFVLGINRVGDGSRAVGVADRWLGGARTNQALCSNQTNHVAELRIQVTTRSITGATVGDLRWPIEAVDL